MTTFSTLRPVALASLVLMVGCFNKDTDEDGLTDREEADLGTDPESADSDQDGLNDGEEVSLGTDPNEIDSDDDGYDDSAEVTEGSDPLDDDDRIYEGGWPYNPNKEDIDDPGWSGTCEEGELLPRWSWVDQYGEEVDNYDFAYQGKPIILDMSTVWCSYCKEMAKWIEGESSVYDGYWEWVPEQVQDGDVYWFTVLVENNSGSSPDEDDSEDWYDDYPNDAVPVFVDEDQDLLDWMDPYGFPTLALIDEDMEVIVYDYMDYTAVFDELEDYFD